MDDWARDNFMRIERELGGFVERNRALENSDALIRGEVREGFARQERALGEAMYRLSQEMAAQNAHLRGEISRLVSDVVDARKTEALRMQQHERETRENHRALVDELRRDLAAEKDEARSVIRQNRLLMAGIGLAIVFGQFVIEHLDDIVALF